MFKPLPLLLCLEPSPRRFLQIQDALFLRAQLLWVDSDAKALEALESWGPSFAGVLVPSPKLTEPLAGALARFGLATSVHGENELVEPGVLEACLRQLDVGRSPEGERGSS